MYCIRCRNLIEDGAAFCTYCGQNQSVSPLTYIPMTYKEDSRRTQAFYISLLTLPLLFIIRTSVQETVFVTDSWKIGATAEVVPDDMKIFMFIILLASTLLNVFLRASSNSSRKSFSAITTVLLFVNIVVGIPIIMME